MNALFSSDFELFPGEWKTQRTLVRDFSDHDVAPLQEVLRALFEESNWPVVSQETYDPHCFEKLLKSPELPLGGKLERFQNQVILDQDQQVYLGWIELYHGHPSEEVLWIGAYFSHPRFHGQGYGGEVVSKIIEQARQRSYCQSIQLGVYLRNWLALRFWQQAGFDKIVRFAGDREYGPNKTSQVVLEYTL